MGSFTLSTKEKRNDIPKLAIEITIMGGKCPTDWSGLKLSKREIKNFWNFFASDGLQGVIN